MERGIKMLAGASFRTLHAEGGGEQPEEVAPPISWQLSLVERHQAACQLVGQDALWCAAAHPCSGLRIAVHPVMWRPTALLAIGAFSYLLARGRDAREIDAVNAVDRAKAHP